MHIGQLAELAGMSLRTIRHYDGVDLLKPSGRTEGGFRIYTDQDLERLLVIRRMKPLGYSLGEMRDLLEVTDALADPHCDNRDALLERLQSFIDSTAERRAKLARNLGWADEFSALLHERLHNGTGSGPTPGPAAGPI